MQYSENSKKTAAPHQVIIDARETLSVSGVTDVMSFDENEIIMETTKGGLTVSGKDLQVESLSLETGDVGISGNIDSLRYHENLASGRGFFARLFK
ncbi:MAG: sporulation protein YabP [Oscillospiraceae bacterium]|jgi:sporulation protein YabP